MKAFELLTLLVAITLIACKPREKSGLDFSSGSSGEYSQDNPSTGPSPSPFPSPFPNPLPGPLPQPTTGQALYTQNCAQCHGDASSSSKRGKNADQITTAISSVPIMRFLGGLTSSQIALIAEALSTTLPPPPPPITGATESISVTVGTREQVASQLADIFIADPTTTVANSIRTVINNLVRNQFVAFGGACDRYDLDCPGFIPGLMNFSTHAPRINAPATPTTNVLRSGYRIRACEEILAIDGAVNNALSKISLTSASERSDANISLLAELFYSDQALPNEAIAALRNVATVGANGGLNTLNQWRFVMISLCEATFSEMY